jgi:hypothetical protein
MVFFGKKEREYFRFVWKGLIAIVAMGVIRFVIGISGVPYEKATHLVSLSVLTAFLFVVYGHRAAATGFGTYRHLLPMAFALSVTMYGFIILAILTEGLTGLPGYFHVHSLHAMAANVDAVPALAQVIPTFMNVPTHIAGQVLAMVVFGFAGWGVASLGFLSSRYLGFLRNAFLALAGLAGVRLLIGAAGVPAMIGTWITSLTVLAFILALYYGYRAADAGFNGYLQMAILAFFIALFENLMVISGILIATKLMLPNYFNPPDADAARHMMGHVVLPFFEFIPLGIFASVAFTIRKRQSAA